MSTSCNTLRDHWTSLMDRLGNPPNAEAVYTKLIALYSEPHRAYHNLSHINVMLDEHRKNECQHLELELAIWFHDAIYNPRAEDNEDRSATLACNSIIDLGLSIGMANQVEKLIMATKHVELPKDDAARELVDLDLMSLSGPEAEFDANSAAIRKEYEHVPLRDYCIARCRILQSFLDRPSIYCTSQFQEKYEESARANLKREIDRLHQSWSELKTPTEVTVNRAQWVCGEYRNSKAELVLGESKLRNSLKKKCCLGFGCIACGFTEDEINNHELPCDLANDRQIHIPLFTKPDIDPVLGYGNSSFSVGASTINDDEHITQEERESKLVRLFKSNGVELKFVGEFPKEAAKIIAHHDAAIKHERGW